jgi:hypothetical protein
MPFFHCRVYMLGVNDCIEHQLNQFVYYVLIYARRVNFNIHCRHLQKRPHTEAQGQLGFQPQGGYGNPVRTLSPAELNAKR